MKFKKYKLNESVKLTESKNIFANYRDADIAAAFNSLMVKNQVPEDFVQLLKGKLDEYNAKPEEVEEGLGGALLTGAAAGGVMALANKAVSGLLGEDGCEEDLASDIRKNNLDYDDEIDALYKKDGDTEIQFQDRETHLHDIKSPSPRTSSHTWGRVWKNGKLDKSFDGSKYEVRQNMAKYLDGKNESLKEDYSTYKICWVNSNGDKECDEYFAKDSRDAIRKCKEQEDVDYIDEILVDTGYSWDIVEESLKEDTKKTSNNEDINLYINEPNAIEFINSIKNVLKAKSKSAKEAAKDDVDWYYQELVNSYPMLRGKTIMQVANYVRTGRIGRDELDEDTKKTSKGKWVNRGDTGETHGEFKTKKEADAQRKAMFARGWKGESLKESSDDLSDKEYNALKRNVKRLFNMSVDEFEKAVMNGDIPVKNVYNPSSFYNDDVIEFDSNDMSQGTGNVITHTGLNIKTGKVVEYVDA